MTLTVEDIDRIFDERNPYDPYDPNKTRMPKLKLACSFVGVVDPGNYDGTEQGRCMVGQVSDDIQPVSWGRCKIVAQWSGVPYDTVLFIFDEMAEEEYADDYALSLKRACEILEVDLPLAQALCRAMSAVKEAENAAHTS